ncbi:MAG: DUF4254 domain-containing protein [Verrucomicrobia bacterium]|nr:DUF4254 domain-containing protein [Verrucomicrobiota bacterium]
MADDSLNPNTITAQQKELTARWHKETCEVTASDPLLNLVEQNHKRNFTLWHHEDDARREDKGFEFVYKAKRAIDRNNQERNDFIEKMDKHLFGLFGDHFTENTQMNSETPGSIIDRLSIMSLKEFHMQEEVDREDASEEHIEKCTFKLGVIKQQIEDLKSALNNLLEACKDGSLGFRVYFQFKMYNDPELNPALYKKTL